MSRKRVGLRVSLNINHFFLMRLHWNLDIFQLYNNGDIALLWHSSAYVLHTLYWG